MAAATAPVGGRLRDETGVTLIEMLIAVSLSLVVATAAMAFMIVSIDQQNYSSSRAITAREAEAGLQQLVRDLRQAMPQNSSGSALHVTLSSASAVSFNIPTPNNDTTPQLVTWTCPSAPSTPAGTCTRQVGAGTPKKVITGVESITFAPVELLRRGGHDFPRSGPRLYRHHA